MVNLFNRNVWLRPSLALGLATFAIHLFTNAGYGIFRDELYFIVCGQRLDWGYVDQPPGVPMLAAWSYALAGDWLMGFRLIPALALSLTVALTAEFTRSAGGGRFAQWLAGLCVLGAPYFLTIGLLFTTDTFQAISWLGCGFILLRLEQTHDERWWLAFGALAGASLLTKYMIGFFLAALAIGLVFTALRRSLLRGWIYLGALLAIVIVLPNVLWQQAHHWPFWELGQTAMNGKNVALSPAGFFAQQLLLAGPVTAPVWLCGLWACLRRPGYSAFRAFAVTYGLLFAFFVATHGKAYYLASIYPALLAIGAVRIECWAINATVRATAVGSIAVASVLAAPFAVPLLPEETFIGYAAALGVRPSAAENQKLGPLPQHFADMHGWREMAGKVAAAYNGLPPQDRAKAVFFGRNYGEAAAIDIYGSKLGMPPAISGHNNYFLWGTRGHDNSIVIEIGGTREEHLRYFHSIEQAGKIDNPYAMPYETNQPIWIGHDPKQPIEQIWPKLRHYE